MVMVLNRQTNEYSILIMTLEDAEDRSICKIQLYARALNDNLNKMAVTDKSSNVTLQLHRGYYHDRYRDFTEVFFL